jgi:hypothetical protein
MQVQELRFYASSYDGYSDLQSSTFALTFKSKLNESFTTIPIVFDPSDIPDFVNDIQIALLSLPNRVIDGVTVAAATDGRYSNHYFMPLLHIFKCCRVESHSNRLKIICNHKCFGSHQVYVNISFTGNSVQGPQHLLEGMPMPNKR